MNIAIAELAGEVLAMKPGLVEALAVKDHLGPHPSHPGHLSGVGGLRSNDSRFDAKQSGSVRHRLAVIPG